MYFFPLFFKVFTFFDQQWKTDEMSAKVKQLWHIDITVHVLLESQ